MPEILARDVDYSMYCLILKSIEILSISTDSFCVFSLVKLIAV